MSTAVITVAHGRHEHLRRQQESLARAVPAAEHRVVVAMDDDEIAALVGPDAVVTPIDAAPPDLPLAAARNLGARTALDLGADVLVFLDVD